MPNLLDLAFTFLENINKSVCAPMNIKIRTSNSQRTVSINSFDELDKKIKELYKIDKYLLFSDQEKTKRLEEIIDGQLIYLDYEAEEAKIYKPEFKCNHSPDAICSKCASLDPMERNTGPDKKVKYLSYKSYLEALKDRGSREEEYNYEIKICEDHSKRTRCSKCMDKQITLAAQVYRMVDYVEFDNQYFLQNFIQAWKDSGRQRLGLLVGNYKEHPDVPLGKKAVVSCIWEIEQENFPDGIALNQIPEKFITEDLTILGIIYTDLITKDGDIICYKKEMDYFLSTVEIAFLDSLKRQFNNPNFIGLAVSLNEDKNIEPKAYMVSEQLSALMKANVLSCTTDPKFFYTERDIVYFIKNEYDKKVSFKANPLVPTDYFLVTCEVGFKDSPLFPNQNNVKRPTPRNLASYFDGDCSFEKFKSFYILLGIQKYFKIHFKKLLTSIIRNDQKLFQEVALTDEFSEFKNLIEKHIEKKWNCNDCTFANESFSTSCEMCGAVKDSR